MEKEKLTELEEAQLRLHYLQIDYSNLMISYEVKRLEITQHNLENLNQQIMDNHEFASGSINRLTFEVEGDKEIKNV